MINEDLGLWEYKFFRRGTEKLCQLKSAKTALARKKVTKNSLPTYKKSVPKK